MAVNQLDYKIKEILDNGMEKRAVIEIYEGEESAQDETDRDGVTTSVTRYRRTRKIGTKTVSISRLQKLEKLMERADDELDKEVKKRSGFTAIEKQRKGRKNTDKKKPRKQRNPK